MNSIKLDLHEVMSLALAKDSFDLICSKVAELNYTDIQKINEISYRLKKIYNNHKKGIDSNGKGR